MIEAPPKKKKARSKNANSDSDKKFTGVVVDVFLGQLLLYTTGAVSGLISR